MVNQYLFHISVIILNHDDHRIIVVRENTDDVFVRECDLDHGSSSRVSLALAGMMFHVKTFLEYFVREEMNSPPLATL